MDEVGYPVRIIVTAGTPLRCVIGTVNDCTKANELTKGIVHDILIADRGYDTNAIIESALENDVIVVMPQKESQRPMSLQ